MQETCIVVPCYNEFRRLPVDRFSVFLKKNYCTFFFVNDGSTDKTLDLLHDLKRHFPEKVKVIDLDRNCGKAEAVRQGFLAAFSNGKFGRIGYLDADLATPLEEIAYLLQYFKGDIKVVIGSRIKRLGAVVERSPLRHYSGRIFATLASGFLDLAVYDSQCGAKIFDGQTAKYLFKEPFASKWLFDLELLYRLKKRDATEFQRNIIEVPLRTWQEKGDSRIRFTDLFAVPFELRRIKENNK